RDGCFSERFGTLNQQFGTECHLLPQARLDERPFTLDVAFEPYVRDASVPRNIGRHQRDAGAIKVFGRRTCDHRRLNKFVDDEALRIGVRSAALAPAGPAKQSSTPFSPISASS